MMSGIAMRYCRSEEDTLQAVNFAFLKVLQNIEKYDQNHALATWIRTILVRHLIDEYRKNHKQIQNIPFEESSEHELALEVNLAEYHFTEMRLRAMLNKLPEVSRTVFNLYAIEGYKHAEIAASLSISEGTSKWHVSEARKRLKQMLKETSEEEVKLKRASI